jgi:hypothetical protein
MLFSVRQGAPLSTGETMRNDTVMLREDLGNTKLVKDGVNVTRYEFWILESIPWRNPQWDAGVVVSLGGNLR